MKAYKLININSSDSSFLEGTVPEDRRIETNYFFRQSHFDKYQLSAHPAPRFQYVVTLKGKLKFTVTNGDSFIIEPGILLIADDLHGKGHVWEILDGDVWERLYIVLPENGEDHFNPIK
ncbi:MAG TPA: hypothetical protein VNZ49_14545 [Bacteroidia bacterium]|jgi:hypothetical protein|nr:hypothetical protein [Bacteroidia bacterium]